jgi:hypothetical protein
METPDMFYMCSHDLYKALYKPQTSTVHGTSIDPKTKIKLHNNNNNNQNKQQ